MIGRFRDFDLAEESLQDAWLTAAEKWPVDGWPDRPEAWIYTVAARRALDLLRARARRDRRELAAHTDAAAHDADELERRADRWHSGVDDDRLRLIFTCCHPTLDLASRVSLTLRSVAWLTTEEIAVAFGVPTATMAQRLVRAKHKIRSAGVPYRVPVGAELPDRLAGVLSVVYLVFNEAYLSRRPDEPLRVDLAEEAIRLGRLLVELMPDEPEAVGLLALMLLVHARSETRFDTAGDLVLLPDQDRSRWHREMIDEGTVLLEGAMRRRSVGPYQLQAAIQALHDEAESHQATDWPQIAALYGVMAATDHSPVVELNRAVAVAEADGPEAGLRLLDELDAGTLPRPHLLHAARGELMVRLGDRDGAARAFEAALDESPSEAERRHLQRRRDAAR